MTSEKNIESAVEAVLFSVGEAVELERLRSALEIDEEALETAVASLKNRLETEDRGVRLIEIGDSVQLCSAPNYFEYIQRAVQMKKQAGLSAAALETLSIIAYNQPVTKGTIEFIRGVDCSYSVTKLTERGFIDEVGRAETPGRPILYGTTEEFLRCFGLKNLDDLPPLPEKAEIPEDTTKEGADVIEAAAEEETHTKPDTEMK
ncbi:MAG: SMC-Scp complex subunit ScpB [Clostridia bacterium]